MEYTVVGLGEILWDMLPSGKQMGGAPANFAFNAQELGGSIIKSAVVSCIGNDALGKEILSRLDSLSLDKTHIAVDSKHPTGTVSVELDNKGIPSYIIHKNVAWDFIPETRQLTALAEKTNAVCFGSLAQRSPATKDTIKKFLKLLHKDALSIFDINLRQDYYSKEIIDSSLELANIFKVNDEELPVVASLLSISGSEEDILRKLIKHYNLKLIVLTKGGQGSLLYSHENNKAYHHTGYKVNVVDSVGAGDAFTAATALGILKKYDLDYIHDCANKVAAFVCTQNGATPKYSDDIKSLFNQ